MSTIAVVCSEFNKELVQALYAEARREFEDSPLMKKMADWQLKPVWIYGAGEIPQTVKWLIDQKKAEAVLALGIVIKGQTGAL